VKLALSSPTLNVPVHDYQQNMRELNSNSVTAGDANMFAPALHIYMQNIAILSFFDVETPSFSACTSMNVR
jgi:hypothetical protein